MSKLNRIIYSKIKEKYNIDLLIFDEKYIENFLSDYTSLNLYENIDSFIFDLIENDNIFWEFYEMIFNGYSIFFRDKLTFNYLIDVTIPKIADGLNKNDEIRVWSVGCSNGQEPYSIAIAIEEVKEKFNLDFSYRVLATDKINLNLEKARSGIYSEREIQNLTLKQVKNYFIKKQDKYHVKKLIKENVNFSKFDIVLDKNKYPPESIFGDFNMVMCNNLIIYYKRPVQEYIINKLQHSVKKNGYLITNSVEKDIVSEVSKLKLDTYSIGIIQKNGVKLNDKKL